MKSCSIYLSHMPSFSFAFSKFWVCKLVITSKWNLKPVGSIVQNSESKLLGDMIWIFLGCYLIVLSKVWKPEVYLWKTKNKVPQWKYKCLPKPYDDFTWENLYTCAACICIELCQTLWPSVRCFSCLLDQVPRAPTKNMLQLLHWKLAKTCLFITPPTNKNSSLLSPNLSPPKSMGYARKEKEW